MGLQLNSNEIAEILPHRYPFALVDRITDGESGVWAKGIKCVSVGEPFFCGHFPQKHVMPGVLILEALAQVGAVAILSLPENRGKIALFGGVKNARFRRKVTPGDVLEMKKEPPCGARRWEAFGWGWIFASAARGAGMRSCFRAARRRRISKKSCTVRGTKHERVLEQANPGCGALCAG